MFYLIDIIGTHTGAHYYDLSYKKEFQNKGLELQILSNFLDPESQSSPFLNNIYNSDIITNCINLLKNILKISLFSRKKKHDFFIYQTYGSYVDSIFILILSVCTKNLLVDVHEVIALDKQSSKNIIRIFKYLYKYKIKTVIYHSTDVCYQLTKFGYNKEIIYVPHFKYLISKEYNIDTIGKDILHSIKKDALNFLFFGHIRKSKGIDLFINSINTLNPEIKQKANFIIAGRDTDAIMKDPQRAILNDVSISLILRHISDDELKFLFKNVDYLVLPYEDISQSGVLEMAVFFERPLITSDLPYFQAIFQKHKSFGFCFKIKEKDSLNKAIKTTVLRQNLNKYDKNDLDRYFSKNEIETFLCQIQEYTRKRKKKITFHN